MFQAFYDIFNLTTRVSASSLSVFSSIFKYATSPFFWIFNITNIFSLLKIIFIVLVTIIVVMIIVSLIFDYMAEKERRRKIEMSSTSNSLAFLGGVIAAGAAIAIANEIRRRK